MVCYDECSKESPFVLISKQDGSITQEIKIPFKEKKSLGQIRMEGELMVGVGPGPYCSIIPFNGDWISSEISSDTVYSFLPDYSLRPFIRRTPPIHSMSPEDFLIIRLLSNRYYFMETIKNVYDWNTQDGFPSTYFMYDTKDKFFSGYTLYNGDFTTKKEIYMSIAKPVNHEIDLWHPLQADQLVESHKKRGIKRQIKRNRGNIR